MPPLSASAPMIDHSTTNNTRPLRLCVLMADPDGCEYEEHDPAADVEQHLRRGGYDKSQVTVDKVFLTPKNYATELVRLVKDGGYDCFINLCDGAWDEPSVGISVVDLLENKLNVPFTGADVKFFEPTRLQMKQVALACGVLVPAWRFIYNEQDLDDFLHEFERSALGGVDIDPTASSPPPLDFPLLVKHFSSYASVGLTKESKVWNSEELSKQCRRMLNTYGGCLVEEFIEGREFTVLAAQEMAEDGSSIKVVAYEPVECKFGEGEDFKHYNLKWVDYDNIQWKTVKEDKDADVEIKERLKAMARNVFRAIQGRGYGRLDVRSDPSGEKLYFLEINPNCGIFYPEGYYGSADMILERVNKDSAHAHFIMNQVQVARELWGRKNNHVAEARYNKHKKSWGMYAIRDLEVGDLIIELEESPFHLVSKQHVMKTWQRPHNSDNGENAGDVEMRNWDNFTAYCWPVADNLFAMWSPEPDDWRPINHSCEPNAWNADNNGLNVVARKSIRAGDEICMDYATFVGFFPEMKPFQCSCKSPECRGTITGLDILKRDVALKYFGHMNSYVASKAEQAHGIVNGLNNTIEQPEG